MFHSSELFCPGLIGEGQRDAHNPFRKTILLQFLPSRLTLARECFHSATLSRVSLSMGGQLSLKLGVCDRIVYQFVFFFSSVLWQSSLSYSDSASTSKGLKALAAAFVVKARNPEVFRISFSSLLSVCTRRLACPEREARFIKFNPSLGWKYTINRPKGSLFEDQMAKQRGSWDRFPVLIRSLLRSLQPPQAASSNRECHATTTVCLTVINLIQQWNLKRAWDTRKLLPGIVRNYLWFKEKSDPDIKGITFSLNLCVTVKQNLITCWNTAI